MGKKLGTVALFLGAFMLALAALSKFYMYDKLAVVPYNQNLLSTAGTMPGADAEYLDVGTLSIQNGPLEAKVLVTGRVEDSKAASKELGRDIAVWDSYTCFDKPGFDCGDETQTPLLGKDTRVAFDRSTGETVAWKGTYSDTGGVKTQPANFEGLIFKFPFDTQKKDYSYYDGTLGKATPAKFVGEGTVKGLNVYKFEQTIEPTKTGTIDVPGSLVGSSEPGVTADRVYSNIRQFSVEPKTGVMVELTENQDGFLELEGQRVLTTTKATVGMSDDTVQATVDEYKTLSMMLTAVKTWIPVGGTIVGLLLIGFGLFSRRDREFGVRKADKGELVGSR